MPRLLLTALLALLLFVPVAQASSSQVMSFEAPAELLLDSKREQTLDEIQSFGVSHVRALVYWRQFSAQPRSRKRPRFDTTDPEAYPAGKWGVLDRLVDSIARRKMTIQLTLTGPVPRWATKKRRGKVKDPSAKWFGRWARAVATRYGARVNMWSIWNEPNHPDFLGPQYKNGRPHAPRLYGRLYRAGERAIHRVRGGSDDIVLFGETAPIGNDRVVAPLRILRGALCLDSDYEKKRDCKRLRVDGYAHHAYARTPWTRAEGRNEVNIASLDRLSQAIDKAVRAGVVGRSARDIYLTEYGIQSKPDRFGVSYTRQAEYNAISERIAYANPRVKLFSQYLLYDDRKQSAFQSGLRTHRGGKKRAYDGFILPLAATRYGSRDVLWGRVRPATGPTRVTIQRRVGKGRWRQVQQVQTKGTTYGLSTAHRRGQRYRAVWTRPDGKRITGPKIRAY
jgi:Cellulase (glycosyl hydrolase family 5)